MLLSNNVAKYTMRALANLPHSQSLYLPKDAKNTSRKKKITKVEEIYRAFFENTQDGIFQTSVDGKLLTANPGLAKMCGFTSVRQMKRELKDLGNQLYVKPNRRADFLRAVRKKGIISNFESQIYRKDRSIIWVSENARAVKDNKGNILYFEGTVHDITIRKKAEEERAKLSHEKIAIKEAEKNREQSTKLLKLATYLSHALTQHDVADIVINKGIKLIGAAAGSVALLRPNGTVDILQSAGYSKKMLKDWQSFPYDMDVPITKAIRTQKPQFIVSPRELFQKFPIMKNKNIQSKDGFTALVVLPIISKHQARGAIGLTFTEKIKIDKNFRTFLLAFAQHVTHAFERAELYEAEKQARVEMEHSQEKLLFLSESTKILTSSLEFKKTLANVARIVVPGFADWCSIDIVDNDGNIQNIAVVHADLKKLQLAKKYNQKFPVDLSARTGIAQVIRTGKSEFYPKITDDMIEKSARSEEHLKILKKTAMRSVMIVPIISHKKPVGTITFIVTNESGRTYKPEDLLFAEEIAIRASIAIDNAKLYEKAQEGIRVRDEFLNIASHELKTPLTSLQLQIQLLLRYGTKQTRTISQELLHTSLHTSETQVKRLGSLINNLLDVSRISNKKFDLDRERVSLNLLVEEVISRFDETLKASGSTIRVRNGKNVAGQWDRFRLDQVATNLISNAIKYGQGKPIIVEVTEKQSAAVLKVRDQGIGIEEEDAKRIFDRFERSTLAKKYGGLGLGLYITKQIIAAHGGKIEVKSIPNKGSEFTVRLPL